MTHFSSGEDGRHAPSDASIAPGKVYFVGAGPGDPELLTLKARRIIATADVVVYADSLVNPRVCQFAREGVPIHKSSSLTLEEIVTLMVDASRRGQTVARLHTGDPSIFGALHEQTAMLDFHGVAYEVVPGVSSVFAAAAALAAELTVPDLSQTVIITRLEGRTPVPPGERLRSLAQHKATLVLFLSVGMIQTVVDELLQGGYAATTPVAVVQRASWEDQMIVRGTLGDVSRQIFDAGIQRQALILVGDALGRRPGLGDRGLKSKLYDKKFSHKYRGASHDGD